MTITPRQIQAVHAAARAAGLSEDAYRDRLRAVTGETTLKALTSTQASAFLVDLGVEPLPPRRRQTSTAPRPRRLPRGVARLATPAQLRLIAALRTEIRWDRRDPAPPGSHPADADYHRWLRGSLGLDRVRTAADARNVIEGLKGLKRSRGR
jgi:hypothetical protein